MSGFDVVGGGLGVGYAASAALKHELVPSLVVVDFLQADIGWHKNHLLPQNPEIVDDPRTRLRHGDFLALSASEEVFDDLQPGRKFHAIPLNIDHSPEELLDNRSRSFCEETDLSAIRGICCRVEYLRYGLIILRTRALSIDLIAHNLRPALMLLPSPIRIKSRLLLSPIIWRSDHPGQLNLPEVLLNLAEFEFQPLRHFDICYETHSLLKNR